MLLAIASAVLKSHLSWVTFRGDLRGSLRIRVVTPPEVARVAITVSNADYGRVSEQDVREGLSVVWFQWRDVPEGTYRIDGLARTTGGVVIQSQPLTVNVR